jgi:hypothetical protein
VRELCALPLVGWNKSVKIEIKGKKIRHHNATERDDVLSKMA